MDLRTRFVIGRARFVVERAARRWRREVRDDLATYVTQAQRDDLLATFDRYPDADTREFRELLTRRPVSGRRDRWPAMGRY